MNFEVTYTPEQEAFRAQVRGWLTENIPEGMTQPVDPADLTLEQYKGLRELGRRLGAEGWLYPVYPKAYGGGDLSVDFVIILEEELDRYGLHLPPYYDSGGRLGGASIFVWGTEEQKQHFLPPIFRGEWRTWQLLSEPNGRFRPGRRSNQGRSRRRLLRDQRPEDLHRQPLRLRDDVDHCGHRPCGPAASQPRLVDDSI